MTITSTSAGWHADPWRRAEWRWWDGVLWTPTVATAGVVWWDAPPAARVGWSGPTRTLPFAGVGLAAAGLVAGILLSGVVALAVIVATGGGGESAVVTITGLFGLWTALVGTCVIASRRLGTGSLRTDLGVGWARMDPLRGVGLNIIGRVATTLVAIPLVAAGWTSSNTKIIQSHQGKPASLALIGVAVVVGAPIVEEMFFRGLLLRSLASRLPWGWAVVIQAVVFGLAHLDPTVGWRTFSLVAITATFGVTQGMAARRWTLGPLMVSHALFNLLPVLVIAFR